MSVIGRKTGRIQIPTLHTETMKNVHWKHSLLFEFLNSILIHNRNNMVDSLLIIGDVSRFKLII